MKLIAFNRGKAISADPIWMGTNRFVKPPKSAGIIRKKIIKKAWAVKRQFRKRFGVQSRISPHWTRHSLGGSTHLPSDHAIADAARLFC